MEFWTFGLDVHLKISLTYNPAFLSAVSKVLFTFVNAWSVFKYINKYKDTGLVCLNIKTQEHNANLSRANQRLFIVSSAVLQKKRFDHEHKKEASI